MADAGNKHDSEQSMEAQQTIWAASALVDHLRRQVVGLIVCAEPEMRLKMYDCIKVKIAACEATLKECGTLLPQKGCPKNYHEENGLCVPDNPPPPTS